MVRKRKASSTSTSGGTTTPTEGAHPRPEVTLRRSSRRLTNKEHDDEEAKTREIQGKILGPRPPDKRKTTDDTVEPDVEGMEREEGMHLAIEGLKRMERRLQIANKRHKRQVEESSFDIPTDLRTKNHPMNPEPMGDTRVNNEKKPRKPPAPSKKMKPPVNDDSDSDFHDDVSVDIVDEPLDIPDRGPTRPPPINSSYLPLPWKGRLGYACLNTYLRAAKPSVFSSRTCRLDSILKHRHPLRDPSQPEHATKNRPDESQAADPERGKRFVQELGLANARDIIKMLRWNDKYNIKFFRLSSEMFPFASHAEHGYKLAPFASEVLAEAGRVAAELGHRLTTHPGQYTQLGSPRKEVVTAAIRDLEYHDELLTLLKLPPQQDRDAVMILHMGGTFESKPATLARFRQNYLTLSPSIKARLVLENDDVGWTVHDLLPICEELNIPLVLDYHHHNILFDATKCREGTYDISQPEIMDRIKATWTRKGIRQKMHYSEQCAGAVTAKDRRKHSARVGTLPPCPDDMDLMIEAKDKEHAVFELMRNFRLPGFETVADVVPFVRNDQDGVPVRVVKRGKGKNGNGKRKRGLVDVDGDDGFADAEDGKEDEFDMPIVVTAEEFGMGGKVGRVYWPPGMEDWLRPKKRETKASKMGAPVNGDVEDEMDFE